MPAGILPGSVQDFLSYQLCQSAATVREEQGKRDPISWGLARETAPRNAQR